MATLTGRMPSRLATQTATVAQLTTMFAEQQLGLWRKRICPDCRLERPTKGQHVCE